MRDEVVSPPVERSGGHAHNSLVKQLNLAIGRTAFTAVHHFPCETKLQLPQLCVGSL